MSHAESSGPRTPRVAFMLIVFAIELALVIGTPAWPRMAVMIVCAGIVPDLIAQRAARQPWDVYRVAYMAWIGAQVGLAIYAWLPLATELPLIVAVVLDQTVFTIPILIGTLVLVKSLAGASLSAAFRALELGNWRHGITWRTLRKNWIFWALLAKPLELGLVRLEIVSAVDVVYVDAALIVIWYTILSFITHAAPRDQKVLLTSA